MSDRIDLDKMLILWFLHEYFQSLRQIELKTILPIAPPPEGAPDPPRSGLERFATARREQAKTQRKIKKLDPSYIFESDEEDED